MSNRIFLSPPHMGDLEKEFVNETFASNWIAPLGPNVDGFEGDLAGYTGAKHAAVLTSGTAAIHLALILLGVKPGDYVICQSFTFSATANPIRYLGATPVFVDSEAETWNMCPLALEKAIESCIRGGLEPKPARQQILDSESPNSETSNPDSSSQQKREPSSPEFRTSDSRRPLSGQVPKAIIPVHLYGMPAKMDRIMEVARKYDIPVIEDAAEALGSHINGRQCGSFGDFGILSFNGNKIITTSGGGALLSDNEAMIQKARFLATQARDPAPHYQHSEIGYNYRMSNILAAVGRGQMQVLDQRIHQRRVNYDFYVDLLKNVPGVTFLPEPPDSFSNRWLTTILVNPEKTGGITCEDIRLALEAENIESRPLWKPMHQQPVFAPYPFFSTGVSGKLFEQGLCLPSGSSLTPADRERIAGVLKGVLKIQGKT
ncbi:MAG: DegT/DnrJ/EryC1/StrS family aminotransferase [Bacteroidales bacterium]